MRGRGGQRDEEVEKAERKKKSTDKRGRTPYTSKGHPSRTNTRTNTKKGKTNYEIFKLRRGQKAKLI